MSPGETAIIGAAFTGASTGNTIAPHSAAISVRNNRLRQKFFEKFMRRNQHYTTCENIPQAL